MSLTQSALNLERLGARLRANEAEKPLTLRQAGELHASIELLTEHRVAELLGWHLFTLQRARRDGSGPPALRLGSRVRYRRSDLEDWLGRLASAGGARASHNDVHEGEQ